MNGKRWAALGIAAVLFIGSIVINVLFNIVMKDTPWQEELFAASDQAYTMRVIEEGQSPNSIVVLEVNGVIQDTGSTTGFLQPPGYNHQEFLRKLEEAGKDNTVKGIIIRVNSPGGGVVESDELHNKIREVQTKYNKLIYVSMGSMAASGGYYISAPADKIFAHPSTMTGSLGVIIQSINYAELADKLGVKWQTIKSGPHKDIMSPTRELTEEERAIMQSMVDNSYERFVNVIANGRGISKDRVREIADGRVYDGEQAKQLNLVDKLGNLDDTIVALKKELGNKQLKVVKYEKRITFDSFLNMGMKALFKPNKDLLGLQKLLSQPQAPQLKYLYTE